MTTLDATIAAARARVAAAAPGPVVFLGSERAFWRLMIRGAVFLAVTLGIYRFWLTTDMRRFLWSNTEVLGETLEYTGTARELLIGFLIAVAILIPFYTFIFALALNLGLIGQLASVIGFALLTVLGQYAVYRARRYRLTRTIYRGVRFHQTGSAWRYAICAMLWWTLVAVSLGLLYPLMQSRLERFKMRNTWLGNLQGRFEGSGARLFFRGLFMWLVVVGPLLASIIALAANIDVKALEQIGRGDAGGEEMIRQLTAASPALTAAFGFFVFALVWSMLIAFILYPVFQAMMLRWWVSGLRFGEVVVASRLRTGKVYGCYLRFVGWSMVFSTIGGIVIAICVVIISLIFGLGGSERPLSAEIVSVAVGIVGYLVIALGYSTIYQVKVRLGLWRVVVESIDLANTPALENVSSVGAPASPIGEGLADALNVGGF
ncbi:MAG: hypothetical protein QOI12_2467 [Alphaproteobacteria bacterium]|jgi:uncharacterized membrane protein YjgN (DUF898 family)|nr:hypothetical protein [Alphaproteobacteria bacterium]